MSEVTLYAVRGKAAWITLNRPEQRNALSDGLMAELSGHLRRAEADAAVRCIVLTGAGSAFCAGADLKRAAGAPRTGPGLADILMQILDGAKPVIAAVNGAAFAGGLGLVAACDIAVAAAEAPFSFAEVRIGVIPAVIAVVCVPKLGRSQAGKLFLTGERFTGVRAAELGLVHRAVPAEALEDAVQAEVDALALAAPGALAACKTLVRRAAEPRPLAEAFADMETWSRRMFEAPEAAEGVAAFREKRRPSWAE